MHKLECWNTKRSTNAGQNIRSSHCEQEKYLSYIESRISRCSLNKVQIKAEKENTWHNRGVTISFAKILEDVKISTKNRICPDNIFSEKSTTVWRKPPDITGLKTQRVIVIAVIIWIRLMIAIIVISKLTVTLIQFLNVKFGKIETRIIL